jgi:N-acyl-D-amino-acid deacylase
MSRHRCRTVRCATTRTVLDIVIRQGQLIDGTGNPWVRADVGIVNGRVASVGLLRDEPARRTIDASGLLVCPGFVDMHAHSDVQLLAHPE